MAKPWIIKTEMVLPLGLGFSDRNFNIVPFQTSRVWETGEGAGGERIWAGDRFLLLEKLEITYLGVGPTLSIWLLGPATTPGMCQGGAQLEEWEEDSRGSSGQTGGWDLGCGKR